MARWSAPMAAFVLCAVAAVRVGAAVISPVAAYGPPNAPAVVTSAAFLSSESDVIDVAAWMRTLYGVHFDDDERNCAKDDKVFYRPTRQCFVLFRRGPCKLYEWLVFDKVKAARGNLTVVCARRKCAPNWGYDAAADKCFDGRQCSTRTALHFTLFGDGACRCNGTYARPATPPGADDPALCYELYHNRPCGKGMILAPRYRLTEGLDAMCFRDPCDGYKPPVVSNSSSSALTPSPNNATPRPESPSLGSIVWPSTRASPGGRPHNHPDPRPGVHDHPGDHHHHYHHGGGGPHPPSGWGGSGFAPGAGPLWVGFRPHRGRGVPDGDEHPFDEEPKEGEFDVEVFSDPSRSELSVKSTTRADVGSSNNKNTNNHNNNGNGNNHGSHEQGHLHAQESSHVHHHGLPDFTIRLKPIHRSSDVANLHADARAARGVHRTQRDARATRNARGEPNPRVDSDSARIGQDSRDGPGAKNGGSWDNTDSRNFEDSDDSSGSRSNTGVPPNFEPYTLEVQHADGSAECVRNTPQNIICDLQMLSLFSDFSEVKVPVCVNAWYRFAIGRTGKSEDCVEDDQGTCVKKVVLKSSEPLDWELE